MMTAMLRLGAVRLTAFALVSVVVAACGGGGGSGTPADADAKAGCAALAHSRIGREDPKAPVAANFPDEPGRHRLNAAAGLVETAARGDRTYAALGSTVRAMSAAVLRFDVAPAASRRRAAVALCAGLKLPHSGTAKAKEDAAAACGALTRAAFPPTDAEFTATELRVDAAGDLAAAAAGDPGYAPLATAVDTLRRAAATTVYAKALPARDGALAACKRLKLPH
jgi:hypothetical protein